MAPEVVGAIVGAGIAGVFSFGTYLLAAASERRRAEAEQTRFQDTRRDQTRATMVEERRRLLDSGAVLLVDVDEVAFRTFESAEASQMAPEWDELVAKLTRFRARLRLWFSSEAGEHEVVVAFSGVLDGVMRLRTFVAGQLRVDRKVLEDLRKVDPDLTSPPAQQIQQKSQAVRAEASLQVETARTRYYSLAHTYLAGDPD